MKSFTSCLFFPETREFILPLVFFHFFFFLITVSFYFLLDNFMIYGGMCRVIWRLAKLLHAANKMYHMPQQRASIVSSIIINRACWSQKVLRYHKGLLQNTTICYILNSLCVRWFSFQPVSSDSAKQLGSSGPNWIQNSKIQPRFRDEKFWVQKFFKRTSVKFK